MWSKIFFDSRFLISMFFDRYFGYWHLSQYVNLHCVTSFLGVPFVKASSSQKQRSSKLILKKSLRYERPVGMVNPPLCQVDWYENFPKYFRKKSTSRSSHVFFQLKTFKRLDKMMTSVVHSKRKLRVKMAIPCWWSSPFWRCEALPPGGKAQIGWNTRRKRLWIMQKNMIPSLKLTVGPEIEWLEDEIPFERTYS